MFILQGSLIIITLLFASLQIGLLVTPNVTKRNVFDIIPFGFLCLFGIYQLLYLPMNFMNGNKMLFYAFFCTIMMILCVIPFFTRRKQFITILALLKDYTTPRNILLLIGLVGLIGFQIYMRCCHMRMDSDDTLYVAWSELSSKTLDFISVNPTFNIPEIDITYLYMFNSWEVFLGMICSFTGINAASLVHTIIPAFVIIISYSGCLALATRFFKKPKEIIFFTFGIAFFHLFSYYSTISTGYFLTARAWFGKSLVANFGIPMIACFMLDFFKPGVTRRFGTILKLAVTGFANIGFNPTAIFLLPIYCLLIFLAYLFSKTRKLIVRIVLIALPLILASLILTYINTTPRGVIFNIPTSEMYDFNLTFSKFFYNGIYFIGAIIIGLLSLIKSRKDPLKFNASVILFYTPLLLLLYVCNPTFAPIIAHYVTTTSTFWRLLWLFPSAYAFGFLFAKISGYKANVLVRGISIVTVMLLIGLGGKYVYSYYNTFQPSENTEKLTNTLIEIKDALEKDIEEKEYQERLSYSKLSKQEKENYNELKRLKIEKQKKDGIPVIDSSTKLIGSHQAFGYLPQLTSKINFLISYEKFDPYLNGYNEEYVRCVKSLRSYANNPYGLSGTTKFKYCVYKTDVDYMVTTTHNYKCQRILELCGVSPLYANEDFILYELSGLKKKLQKNPPVYTFKSTTTDEASTASGDTQ